MSKSGAHDLPNGWATARINALTEFVTSGSRGWAKYYAEEGALFIRVGNFIRTSVELSLEDVVRVSPPAGAEGERTRVRPNDVLMTITADVGMVAAVKDVVTAYVNQHVALLRPVPGVEARALAYSLMNPTGFQAIVREAQYGATKPGLSLIQIRNFETLVPPLAEQRRIVAELDSYLSRLDAAVAGLERVQANLKRYRASVLKAAVEGRLVPTEAELARAEGRTYEPASELLARILKERRARWEAAELASMKAKGKPPKDDKWKSKYQEPAPPDTKDLPELREGWCWARIDTAGTVQLGRQRAPGHHQGSHMRPYLRVANVFEDRIDTTDVMSMNFTPEEFERYQLKWGDILLNEGQSPHLVGRPAMYRDEVPGSCFTNTLIRFRAAEGIEPRFALVVFLAQLHSRRYMRIAQITTNIAHLGAARFAEIEFPIPPRNEQRRIADEVERAMSLVEATSALVAASIEKAARLRQAILKWAFEGKLVDQDPNDEPASVLLERIRAEREAAAPAKRTRTKKTPSTEPADATPAKRQRKKTVRA